MSEVIKRDQIVQEIYSTEKVYTSYLNLVVQLFLCPLRVSCLLPDTVLSAMFANIEAILAINMELVIAMREMSVGNAFLRLAPFLRLYSLYANNFQRANQLVLEWTQRSSKFDGFKRAQECRPECSGLSLLSLLIMPVQRVPRYKLLLEELLKYTPHDDLDWIKLDAACKKIGEVAIHINEHIRQHENFQEMLRIQRSLSGVPDILVPGRRFIKEGCLKKVCGRKLKERMCYLFSDLFVYARPNILETVDSASRYHCRGVLELAFCSVAVQTFDDVLHLPNTELLLKIQCKNHSLLLCAGSDGETQSWYNSMSAAIRGLLDQHRCLLEEVQKRITTDSTHALRNRISAHIDQSLDKTCNASDCYPNVSHNGFPHLSDMTMTSVKTLENSINSGHHSVDHKAKDMATRRVTVESRNEDIEAEDIITSGSSNLQAVEMTGKTHGLCVPMQRAARGTVNKLQTTTYDVERQRVHSTICTIL